MHLYPDTFEKATWHEHLNTCGALREHPSYRGGNTRLVSWRLHVAAPVLLEFDACDTSPQAHLTLVRGCVGEPTFDGPVLSERAAQGACPRPRQHGLHASVELLEPGLYTAALAVPNWVPCKEFHASAAATPIVPVHPSVPGSARAETSEALGVSARGAPLGLLSGALVVILAAAALALLWRARWKRGATSAPCGAESPMQGAML